MGASTSRTDFERVDTLEPHASRRKIILQKYPQIKNLMVVDPNFKWVVTFMVSLQIASFFVLSNVSSIWILLVSAYCFGGVINHSLMLAVHEIAHNQAFGPSRPFANKAFVMFANLPIGIPMSISFKNYHLEHHRYQGDDVLDTDIPSVFETRLFTSTLRKIVWVFLQPAFYSIRPLFVNPRPPSLNEFINLVVQLAFDAVIGYFFGVHIVVYMVVGSFLAMGLHPVAGHFISEHYLFDEIKEQVEQVEEEEKDRDVDVKDYKKKNTSNYDALIAVPETCSYYGPINLITFNVGYHVEHHDFPSIPGSLLPQVREIAPEFYNHLKHHTSYVKVLWDYITGPNVCPFARVKRATKKDDKKQD